MKHFTTFALVATFAGIGMAACSSDPSVPSTGGAGSGNTGGKLGGTAGSPSYSGSVSTAGVSTGGVSTGGVSTGGVSTGGVSMAGGGAATAGNTSAGSANGGSGGSGGGNPNAVEATCGIQMYTPSATPGAACATTVVPAAPLIAAFESGAAGWHVYPENTAGFAPNTATPSPGGANGTANALAFKVTNVDKGIRIQVDFGMQCQDVRTFKGLSFWAKGTVDKYDPYQIPENNLVVYLNSEKTENGGCTSNCAAGPHDKRVPITANWTEYRVPFDCFGDATTFDGYYTRIWFDAMGTNSDFAIDEVGYYK